MVATLLMACGAPSVEVEARASAELPPAPAPDSIAEASRLVEAARASSGTLARDLYDQAREMLERVVGAEATKVQLRRADKMQIRPGVIVPLPGTSFWIQAQTTLSTRRGVVVSHEGVTTRFDPEPRRFPHSAPPAPGELTMPAAERYAKMPAKEGWVVADLAADRIIMAVSSSAEIVVLHDGTARVMDDEGAKVWALPEGTEVFSRPEATLTAFDDVAGAVALLTMSFADDPPPAELTVMDLRSGRRLGHWLAPPTGGAYIGFTFSADASAIGVWRVSGACVARMPSGAWQCKNYPETMPGRPPHGPYFTIDGAQSCRIWDGISDILPARPAANGVAQVCGLRVATERHTAMAVVDLVLEPPWHPAHGQYELGNFANSVGGNALSPDGLLLAIVETNTTSAYSRFTRQTVEWRMRVVDTKTGKTVRTWPLGTEAVRGSTIAFVDARHVRATWDGGDHVFDVQSGEKKPPPEPTHGGAQPQNEWKHACAIGPVLAPVEVCR